MDYRISARIVVEDSSTAGARSAQRNLEGVERTGKRVSLSLTSMFQRAFMFIGGAAGAGMALRGILRLHTGIQEAQVGMATLLSANTGAPLVQTLGQAREVVQGLRKDAAVGVGEFENYLEGMQSILGPGLQAGASLDQMRELNRLALSAGFALRGQEGLRFAPMDIAQALTRGASRIETPIVMQALAAVGMTEAVFNKLDVAGRMKVLQDAFGRFGPGVEEMGKGWNAQFSTLTDRLKEMARTATEPLFGRWSDQLRRANEWLERNEGRLQTITETWGTRLVATWDHLIEQAGTYAAIVAGASLAQYAPGAIGGARSAGSSAAGLWGRLAGAASWGASLPGRSGFWGRLGGGAAGLTGEAGAVSRGLLQALGKAAGPLAVITTALLALVGGLQEFPGVLAFLTAQWAGFMAALGGLGGAFGSLTEKGSVLNQVGAALGLVLGGLVWLLTQVVRIVGSLAIGLGVMLQVIGDGFKAIYFTATGQFAKAAEISVMGRLEEANRKLAALWVPDEATLKKAGEGVPGTGEAPGTGDKPKTQVNIGKVEIRNDVRGIDDLPILVRSFDDMISRITDYRRGARRVPVPTF